MDRIEHTCAARERNRRSLWYLLGVVVLVHGVAVTSMIMLH